MNNTDDLESDYDLQSEEAREEFIELIQTGQRNVVDQMGNVLLDRGNGTEDDPFQFPSEELTQAFLRVLHSLGLGPDIWVAGRDHKDSGGGDMPVVAV